MTRNIHLEHVFVDSLPEQLDEQTLYVCIPYATVAHRCVCGCENEVVTPLGRADWTLSYDGEAVSLSPSVGSWSLPCRSHYVIKRNEARWARSWTTDEVETGRSQDRHDRERTIDEPKPQASGKTQTAETPLDAVRPSLWRRVVAMFMGRRN